MTAAHKIISGASLPCRPDPLCVCAVKTISIVGVLYHRPTVNLKPPEKMGAGIVHTLTKTQLCTYVAHTRTHTLPLSLTHTYTWVRAHTHTCMVHSLSSATPAACHEKILISVWQHEELNVSLNSRSSLSLTPLSFLCPLSLLRSPLLISPPYSTPSTPLPPSSPPFISPSSSPPPFVPKVCSWVAL